MAVTEDDLAQLEEELQDHGYGHLVSEAVAELEPEDATVQRRFELLLDLLDTAVVPAARARAASIRLLSSVEGQATDVEPPDDEFRVPRDRDVAASLEREATALAELVAHLRAQANANEV